MFCVKSTPHPILLWDRATPGVRWGFICDVLSVRNVLQVDIDINRVDIDIKRAGPDICIVRMPFCLVGGPVDYWVVFPVCLTV